MHVLYFINSLKTATLIINNYVRVSWIATTHQETKKQVQKEKKNRNVSECAFRKSLE